jgi:hypothetical protein
MCVLQGDSQCRLTANAVLHGGCAYRHMNQGECAHCCACGRLVCS